ncbi:MAG: hypothetical protein GY816_00580 [Cytophagales bacterium]|nr:hypothetical protein [Cytophagales bacterium]
MCFSLSGCLARGSIRRAGLVTAGGATGAALANQSRRYKKHQEAAALAGAVGAWMVDGLYRKDFKKGYKKGYEEGKEEGIITVIRKIQTEEEKGFKYLDIHKEPTVYFYNPRSE